jgi:hypothetical protein
MPFLFLLSIFLRFYIVYIIYCFFSHGLTLDAEYFSWSGPTLHAQFSEGPVWGVPLYKHSNNERIGGIMVCMPTSSAVDRASQTRLGQTKDYNIGTCCFSTRHTILWSRANNGLAGNHDMCQSWLTCLPANCCFSVLTKRTSSSSHPNKNVDIRFSVHDDVLTQSPIISQILNFFGDLWCLTPLSAIFQLYH